MTREERRSAIAQARSPKEIERLVQAPRPKNAALRAAISKAGRQKWEDAPARGCCHTGAGS